MPKILFVGKNDALYRSRRILLTRAGYELHETDDVARALSERAWRKCALTLIGNRLPAEERRILQQRIEEDGAKVIDLAKAFQEYGTKGHRDDGPETFLDLVGRAVMEAHAHPELKGSCVAFVDGDRHYIQVSDGFLELIGYHRDEVLGSRIDDFTYPGTADAAKQFVRYLEDGRQAGRYFLRHKSGKKITVDFEAGILPDGCMCSTMRKAED